MERILFQEAYHVVIVSRVCCYSCCCSPILGACIRPSPPFLHCSCSYPVFDFLCLSMFSKIFSASLAMDDSKAGPIKEMPLGLDSAIEDEYASQSKLLQEFTSIPNIDKAWIFKSDDGMIAHVYIFFFFFNLCSSFPQHWQQEFLTIIFVY
jgi:hypothetical protein